MMGKGQAFWEPGRRTAPEDSALSKYDAKLNKRGNSLLFKSLVIELDKDLYGPDNHMVEWHRTTTTQETDGFQVN